MALPPPPRLSRPGVADKGCGRCPPTPPTPAWDGAETALPPHTPGLASPRSREPTRRRGRVPPPRKGPPPASPPFPCPPPRRFTEEPTGSARCWEPSGGGGGGNGGCAGTRSRPNRANRCPVRVLGTASSPAAFPRGGRRTRRAGTAQRGAHRGAKASARQRPFIGINKKELLCTKYTKS